MELSPSKGAHRLDERDGHLYYGDHMLCPIADVLSQASKVIAWPLKSRLSDAICGSWHFYAIYRCRRCEHWATGSGSVWCSQECRRLDLAQSAKERRAAKASERAIATCVVCGASIQASRGTRRYCSDRCRQSAHRRKHGMTVELTELRRGAAPSERSRNV